MKRVLLWTLAAGLLLSGCSGAGETAATQAAPAETTIRSVDHTVLAGASYTGTVTAVSQDSITISTDDGAVTVALTEETVYQRSFEDQPVELPEGTMPEAPDANGETPPEAPQGQPPENAMNEGTPPEGAMPDGAMPEGTMPEGSMPDGAIPEGTPPYGTMPEGEGPQGGRDMGEDRREGQSVAPGDTVTIQTDENGRAATITVTASDRTPQTAGGFTTLTPEESTAQ